MTYESVEAAVKDNTVELCPVGIVEAYDSHLPLGTDIFATLNQASEIKLQGGKCVFATPFYYGGTQAVVRQFAGTFAL